MKLKFYKMYDYSANPGAITFATKNKMIGVANNDGTITEFGGGVC